LVIDTLFFGFRIYQKYLITTALVGMFFIYYFSPFVDPYFLYSTEEIKQWKTLSQAVENLERTPTAAELASTVTLETWEDGKPVGELFPDVNLARIEYLLPYLDGDNYLLLLTKPIYIKHIHMNVLIIGFILLFFGYQYKKDPPQGAYIDKMLFLFLIYSSLEILHFWGSMQSVEKSAYVETSIIGQYITIFVELLIVSILTLRLRFITSVQGEFYESELASNPQQISRWRDWIDNLVLNHFFNAAPFKRRFFQPISEIEDLNLHSPATTPPRGTYGQGQ
jgi:hypothetical protein